MKRELRLPLRAHLRLVRPFLRLVVLERLRIADSAETVALRSSALSADDLSKARAFD
jgi:hypothetical protein